MTHTGNGVRMQEMDYPEDGGDEYKIWEWLYKCTDYSNEDEQSPMSSLFHCYCNFHGTPLVGIETFTLILENNFCLELNTYGRQVAKQFNHHSGLSDQEVKELNTIGELQDDEEREFDEYIRGLDEEEKETEEVD